MSVPYEMIEDQASLESMMPRIESEPVLAIDVEADSMFHFREKVCLIQIGTADSCFVVDPLRIPDLSPLKTIFAAGGIRKIFHGSDYDVRSLYRDFAFEIENLFDTQVACMFLGYRETGLEAVLRKRFQVQLDKKYQKKDWSQRPLPPEMVAYAAGDVRFLLPLARELEQELVAKNRLEWVLEECWLLAKARPSNCGCPANKETDPLFLRFKGAGRLKSRGLAVLEALLQLRMTIAEEKDRPVFKTINNDVILKLAVARPLSMKRLQNLQILSAKQSKMYADRILRTIREAMELPKDALPVYPRKRAPRMPRQVPRRVELLKQWRSRRAADLGMDPGLACNKALITALAVANPSTSEELARVDRIKQWQCREFGREIVEVLKRA
jgi:ribonuclease D